MTKGKGFSKQFEFKQMTRLTKITLRYDVLSNMLLT